MSVCMKPCILASASLGIYLGIINRVQMRLTDRESKKIKNLNRWCTASSRCINLVKDFWSCIPGGIVVLLKWSRGVGYKALLVFPLLHFMKSSPPYFLFIYFFCLIIVKYNESTGRMWQVILSYALLFYNKEPGVIFKYMNLHAFPCVMNSTHKNMNMPNVHFCAYFCN